MMKYYFVKRPLYGIEAGHVERFADHKAGALLMDESIEPYNHENNTHRIAPGAPAEAPAQPQVAKRYQSRAR